jgi:hypothetical protein
MGLTQSIAWRRVLAEGAVIVLSILVAFGIDAWWDGRREAVTLRANLEAIAAEISDQSAVRQGMDERREQRMAVMRLLVNVSGPQSSDLSSDSVDTLLGHLWGAAAPTQPIASIDALRASGAFPAIRSNELRLALVQLERRLSIAAAQDERALETWESFMRPYLVAAADVRPQVRNRGGLQLESYERVFDRDPRAVLQDPDFQNLLLVRMNRVGAARQQGRLLLQEMDELAGLIASELER